MKNQKKYGTIVPYLTITNVVQLCFKTDLLYMRQGNHLWWPVYKIENQSKPRIQFQYLEELKTAVYSARGCNVNLTICWEDHPQCAKQHRELPTLVTATLFTLFFLHCRHIQLAKACCLPRHGFTQLCKQKETQKNPNFPAYFSCQNVLWLVNRFIHLQPIGGEKPNCVLMKIDVVEMLTVHMVQYMLLFVSWSSRWAFSSSFWRKWNAKQTGDTDRHKTTQSLIMPNLSKQTFLYFTVNLCPQTTKE